jgi:hypothetical protein
MQHSAGGSVQAGLTAPAATTGRRRWRSSTPRSGRSPPPSSRAGSGRGSRRWPRCRRGPNPMSGGRRNRPRDHHDFGSLKDIGGAALRSELPRLSQTMNCRAADRRTGEAAGDRRSRSSASDRKITTAWRVSNLRLPRRDPRLTAGADATAGLWSRRTLPRACRRNVVRAELPHGRG